MQCIHRCLAYTGLLYCQAWDSVKGNAQPCYSQSQTVKPVIADGLMAQQRPAQSRQHCWASAISTATMMCIPAAVLHHSQSRSCMLLSASPSASALLETQPCCTLAVQAVGLINLSEEGNKIYKIWCAHKRLKGCRLTSLLVERDLFESCMLSF